MSEQVKEKFCSHKFPAYDMPCHLLGLPCNRTYKLTKSYNIQGHGKRKQTIRNLRGVTA